MEINKSVDTIVKGKVLGVRVPDSIPKINSGCIGNYEVDLLDSCGNKRTFRQRGDYGKLPHIGTEQAYSSEHECDPKYPKFY